MKQIEGSKVTENIYYCSDGKYRWVYEFNMLKNPIILLTIWKILGIAALIILVFFFLIEVFDGNAAGWFTNYLLTPEVLIIPGILFGLSIIAYLIVALINGWKYIVLFEMDDNGVDRTKLRIQYEIVPILEEYIKDRVFKDAEPVKEVISELIEYTTEETDD